jgi:hypothetical protein
MQGPLIFFASLVSATLGICAALYGLAKDTKPEPARAVAPHRRERFWNFR